MENKDLFGPSAGISLSAGPKAGSKKSSLFESDAINLKSKKPKRLKSVFKRAVKSLSIDKELVENLKLLFYGIIVILIKIVALYLLYLCIKELL